MKRKRLLAGLALALLVIACGRESSRQRRPAVSGWVVTAESEPILSADLQALEEVGVGEIWPEAARIVEAGGGVELRTEGEVELPARTPVTLLVTGRWPGEGGVAGLVAELRRLVITEESRSRIPQGLHFDLAAGDSLVLAEGMRSLRSELGRSGLRISVSVDRDQLADETLPELLGEVDFVVCDLYGQPPGAGEDTRYWDLAEVEADVRRLEALEVPYLVGVHAVGAFDLLGEDGTIRRSSTRFSLMQLIRDPDIELAHGFTLDGIDRQLYSFVVVEEHRLGDWPLRAGERLRVTRLASHHLAELERRLSKMELEGHLGQLYHRQRRPGELFTPNAAQLAVALGPEPAAPELVIVFEKLSGNGSGGSFRVVLRNGNNEPTDLASIESNYLELRVRGGDFGAVDPGGFQRYDLLKTASDGELYRTLSRPDVLRLYQPLVEGFGTVASGAIDVRADGNWTVVAEGRFLLPDSRMIDLTPVEGP